MASLEEFLEVLAGAYPDEKVRGKKFEPFLRDALLASPSHQFADVWTWYDWPDCDGQERGIDLVAKDLDGGLWGIQSKLKGLDKRLNWKELATWFAATRDDPWVQRLLVSTASRLSGNLEKELVDDPKTLLLLGEDLFDLRVVWPDSLAGSAVRADPLEPKPHQVEAIEAICDGFNGGAARLQVHMACGTGKTFTALWAYQYLAPDLAVVLVPSLSLMEKEIREWTANTTIGFRFLPVCSDVKVAEDERPDEDPDPTVGDLSVLDAPATTDVDTIVRFLRLSEPRVVFCTYQSSDVLADACAAAGVRFGLVVADEAHRTAGRGSRVFTTVLDDDRFPADRRLFMTGTPRIFTAAKDDDETVQSMDDTDTYGEVAYRLGFGEAVELGLLANYEVFVVAVEDPVLREVVLAGGSVELAGLERRVNVSALVSLEGALRAIDELDMSRLLSFHSRIKGAADWASAIPAFQKWRGHGWDAEADTVNGKMNASERKRKLGWLEKATDKPRLLTNARCLSEGIDVPSLDGIVFADPRRSQVDIVQAIGRVMRNDPDRDDKVGRIVIPVVVPDPDSVDGDDVFRDSLFKPIWDVLRALKAHDFRLEAELNRLRGLTALGPVAYKEFLEATHLRIVGIDDLDKFQLAILEKTTSNFWWWLNGPLAQFVEREGHASVQRNHVESFQGTEVRLENWIRSRRKDFKAGRLSAERIAVLEEVPGWAWDPFEAAFQEGLGVLGQFVEREGHARVPASHLELFDGVEVTLGSWVGSRRKDFDAGGLPAERITALEAVPGWVWDAPEAAFQEGLGALGQFAEREGHARVPASHLELFDGVEVTLGSWVSNRRTGFKAGKLSAERIAVLEAFPGWVWDLFEADFQEGLGALAQFVKREHHARVPQRRVEPFQGVDVKLGGWVSSRRKEFSKGELSSERIDAILKTAPGWVWDVKEADFQEGLGALAQFVKREHHARVPRRRVEPFKGVDVKLGNWVHSRRKEFSKEELSPERIAALDALGFDWDHYEAAFQEGLGALAQFVKREHHARVPQRRVEPFQGVDVPLGGWVSNRRRDFNAGRLSPERIAALDALGFDWDQQETDFQEGLGALAQFVKRERHARVPASRVEPFKGVDIPLGRWVSNRRNQFSKGELSSERIDAILKTAPGWVWDVNEAAFQEGLGALAQFVKREHHARVPQSRVEPFQGVDVKLGGWVSSRRRDFNAGRLSAERITALEAFPGWVWDASRR